MKKINRVLFFLLIILIFFLWVMPQLSEKKAHTTAITYLLDWNLRGIEKNAVDSFKLQNNLGYEIKIKKMLLTNYSMQLVLCREKKLSANAPHESGSVPPNETRTTRPWIEKAFSENSLQWFEVAQVSLHKYCQARYQLKKALPTSFGIEESPEMTDYTLLLGGTYKRPNETSEKPFSIHSKQADEVMIHVSSFTQEHFKKLRGDQTNVTLRIIRQAAKLFDEVDFETMSEEEQGQTLLRNLTHHTTLNLEAHTNNK